MREQTVGGMGWGRKVQGGGGSRKRDVSRLGKGSISGIADIAFPGLDPTSRVHFRLAPENSLA